MPPETTAETELQAKVDFACLDEECRSTITFNVMDLCESNGKIACPECHRLYHFDTTFRDKLKRLRTLILSVQEAEDILGDACIAVTTATDEVKIPYRLLLTRLNSIITLNVGGQDVTFHFRIEPLNNGTFK